jgi:predicted small secreted protein
MKSTLKTAALGIMALTSLSSCNTAIGLGRDMRVLGTEVEKKAEQGAGGAGAESQTGAAPVY